MSAKNTVPDVNSEEFEATLADNSLVLVDFWAIWCRPCKALAPILDDVATAFEGRLSFVKLNVDDFPAIAEHYGIRGLPSLVLFRDGEIVEQKAGAATATELSAWLETCLTELA